MAAYTPAEIAAFYDHEHESDYFELTRARLLAKQLAGVAKYEPEEHKVPETCPEGHVDIRGLDKYRLLETMCANRAQLPTFIADAKANTLNCLDRDYVERLVKASSGHWGFDYVRGSCIKSDLSGPWMSVWGYDRDVVGRQLKAADIVCLIRDSIAASRPEPVAPAPDAAVAVTSTAAA